MRWTLLWTSTMGTIMGIMILTMLGAGMLKWGT